MPAAPDAPRAPRSDLRALAVLAVLGALLAAAWLAYRPGLSGGFLFDDHINLDALGRYGPVDDGASLLRYATSGTADPTGRPLSLLSFLLDARDWPADPASFLRTNLLLHLLNGMLLFALLARLGAALGDERRRAAWIAVLGAGLWLLHPLWVSTTLYAVQREAMLPATFVLLGLLAFVVGRVRLDESDGRRGLGWIVAGLVGGTVLATLCKANGMLLPILAGVVEGTVFARNAVRAPLAARRLAGVRAGLWLGALAIFALLASYLPRLPEMPASRTWTIGQRLLTEPRLLLDYQQFLAVPRAVSTGLYNDHVVAARSLFDPVSTLPALVAVLGLAALAVGMRRRAPALACAVGFFLAGHLLESTVVPLELYFEHRNYLPALLLGWPLARAITAWRRPAALRVGVAAALLAVLAGITWQRASLWGQPDRMAALWLLQAPHSPRAQATVAIALVNAGDAVAAEAALAPAANAQPLEPQVVLNYARAACIAGNFGNRHANAVANLVANTRSEQQLVFQWLAEAMDVPRTRTCPRWKMRHVAAWIELAGANPHLTRSAAGRENLHLLRGRLALERRDLATAEAEFATALRERAQPRVALGGATLLAANGDTDAAVALLDAYDRLATEPARARRGMPQLHAWVLRRQGYWPREVEALRTRLREQAARAPAGSDRP
jgi:hypothetical protein